MVKRACSRLLGGTQVQVVSKNEWAHDLPLRKPLKTDWKNWFGMEFAIRKNGLTPLFLGVELVCNVTPRTTKNVKCEVN
jgi:hypothetical protein